jgi:integrase
MKFNMRLFRNRGIYFVEIERGKTRSLKTRDGKRALSRFREIEKEAIKGRLLELERASRITLSDFIKRYIKYREELKDLSSETIKKDKAVLKLLEDVEGDKLLISVDLDKFKNVCLSRKVKKISINGYLRHIKTAMKWAVDESYLKKLPKFSMYKNIKKQESELLTHILEPAEIRNFLRTAYKRNRAFGNYCLVTLYTGGRRRESLNIRYEKTDFKNDRITLTGKTGSRTIPMLRPVKIVLEKDKKDIGRIFPDWHPDTITHWVQTALTDAGIVGHRLHDLRHTAATYLLKNGVSLETTQRILGHSQISTTQLYAQVLDEIMKSEMRKLKFK